MILWFFGAVAVFIVGMVQLLVNMVRAAVYAAGLMAVFTVKAMKWWAAVAVVLATKYDERKTQRKASR